MKQLWQVTLRKATFGVVVERGFVIEAAPIGGWMKGKSLDEVIRWVRARGGDVQRIGELDEH